MVPALQTQAYGARSFSVAAPTLWNSLPVDIANAQSLFILKRSPKHFYLMNFTRSFITLFFSLCVLFISYICKFYFLHLSSALRLGKKKTRVEVWENEKCCGNTNRRRVFPQLFRVLPNFHECLYNSIETRSTCFLFLLGNNATRKRKTTC